jgi:hypothetical protein
MASAGSYERLAATLKGLHLLAFHHSHAPPLRHVDGAEYA